MKVFILSILLILLLCQSNAQFVNTQTISSRTTLYKTLGGFTADSGIIISNVFADTNAANNSVVKFYNSIIRVGSNLYYRSLNPNRWNLLLAQISGGYLAVSDTVSMLSGYRTFYPRNAISAGSGISYNNVSGVISNTSPDQTVTLTAGSGISVSGTYPNFTVTNTSTSSGGTVTLVQTNNATGIVGGNITNQGLLFLDTVLISTRAWRQKGIDSLGALVNAKLNISDTAAMLNNLLRISDTTTMLSNRLKISDTASMLSPYARLNGTTNYISKFTSSNTLGNSLIFDDGSKVVIGGTTGSSLFNLIGQGSINNTTTYSSGTSTALGILATTTYTGTLPTSNVSYSSSISSFFPQFNGNTTIEGGSTPFSSFLPVNTISFTNTGTATINNSTGGIKAISAINIQNNDAGSVNGTVNRTAGLQISGIFKVAGATATITRTDHYQLLISDINEYGNGGDVTNKWGIYQIGSNDVNLLNGQLRLPNLAVYADNAAATSGGLPVGALYRTSTGVVMVRY